MNPLSDTEMIHQVAAPFSEDVWHKTDYIFNFRDSVLLIFIATFLFNFRLYIINAFYNDFYSVSNIF